MAGACPSSTLMPADLASFGGFEIAGRSGEDAGHIGGAHPMVTVRSSPDRAGERQAEGKRADAAAREFAVKHLILPSGQYPQGRIVVVLLHVFPESMKFSSQTPKIGFATTCFLDCRPTAYARKTDG